MKKVNDVTVSLHFYNFCRVEVKMYRVCIKVCFETNKIRNFCDIAIKS